MRLRFIPEASGIVKESRYVVHDPEALRGQWRTYFEEHRTEQTLRENAEQSSENYTGQNTEHSINQNDKTISHETVEQSNEKCTEQSADQSNKQSAEQNTPSRKLYVEIGMGKGRFAVDMALAHPEDDFIGVEKYESVLFRACERMEGIPYNTPRDKMERAALPESEQEKLEIPDNLHFISIDAAELPHSFLPGEVDGIYLNFSDPWPKARHAKRRLTSHQFLETYEQYLKDGGRLEFKTDNTGLFDFSVEEVKEAPHWELIACTHDLHHDEVLNQGNIMTEYERKFSALGNKICKLIAVYHQPEQNENTSDSENAVGNRKSSGEDAADVKESAEKAEEETLLMENAAASQRSAGENTEGSATGDLAWKLAETEHLVHDSWIDFRRSSYQMPDGRTLGPFYTYSRKDYTVIVAIDEEGRYICVNQYRQGIGEVTTEFPAGGIETGTVEEYRVDHERGSGQVQTETKADPAGANSRQEETSEGETAQRLVRTVRTADESILEAAKRELAEETGYESDHWTHLLTVPSDATISDNYAHIYLAENCRKVQEQQLDSTEFLHCRTLSREELESLIKTRRFQQAIHILAYELSK